jgi:hypothetical protein
MKEIRVKCGSGKDILSPIIISNHYSYPNIFYFSQKYATAFIAKSSI